MKNIKEKIIDNKNVIICAIIMIILAILKQCLMLNIPILAYISAGEDDALMIKFTHSILDGKWLGDYAYNTLMKGPVFPLILALLYKFGLSYISTMTLLYTISCIVFMIAIRKRIKSKKVFIMIYALLLFNPIMYSRDIIQRVYRNSLIPSFALFIIGGYIAIFLRRNEKKRFLVPWILLEMFVLPLFYYTREDSIWIIPFLVFIIISTVIAKLLEEKKVNLDVILKTCMLMIPVAMISLFGNWISLQNEKHYGLKTTNIMSESNFGPALEAIFAVKPNEYIDCVSVPIEKIDRMAAVSDSFRSITPALKQIVVSYNQWDRNTEDGELEDGWISWAIKAAALDSGYTTLAEEQVLYARICTDLNAAMEQGLLERQSLVPFSKTSTWRSNYTLPFIKNMGIIIKYIATFENMNIYNTEVSTENPELFAHVRDFEKITGDRAIYPEKAVDTDGNIIPEVIDQKEYLEKSNRHIAICHVLTKIYSVISPILLLLGIVSYIVLTVQMIKDVRKKKYKILEYWIMISSILGAVFTLVVGITYNHTTTVYSLVYLYLCATYPLYFVFSALSIYGIYEFIPFTRKNKKTETVDIIEK